MLVERLLVCLGACDEMAELIVGSRGDDGALLHVVHAAVAEVGRSGGAKLCVEGGRGEGHLDSKWRLIVFVFVAEVKGIGIELDLDVDVEMEVDVDG